MAEHLRPAWVEVDLDAITANAHLLVEVASPAGLCAVVKADGYGHGAVSVARAALAGGASWLAVALVEEGRALREAGIDAPVLVLSEPTTDAMAEAFRFGLTPTLYRLEGVEAARRSAPAGSPYGVQVKVDTGMHRVGCPPADLARIVGAVAAAPELELAGLWSHLAVADEPADSFTAQQLGAFTRARDELAALGIVAPLHHVANSAGLIAFPAARLDLVRCGIALYGYLPAPGLAAMFAAAAGPGAALTPALALKARIHQVRDLPAGEATSYGRRYRLERAARIATVPLGYHDGVSRRLAETGGEVLVRGRRCPIAGTVTMDQILIDCGEAAVEAGEEVVLIGRQGEESISAEEWADRLSTIVYEVLCGIGPRVPRRSVGGDGMPAEPSKPARPPQ